MITRSSPSRLLAFAVVVTTTMLACRDRDMPTSPRIRPGAVSYVNSPATPVVNTLFDDGNGTCDTIKCTLRDAIAYADSGAFIAFAVTGTLSLTQGVLWVSKDVTIHGPGIGMLRISGRDSTPVFSIDWMRTVRIANLTIGNGYSDSVAAGVWNMGTLTLDTVRLTDNVAHSWGAAVLNYGELMLRGSTVDNNLSIGDTIGMPPGAVVFSIDSTTTIVGSAIRGNIARGDAYGAGVGFYLGAATIDETTISGDSAMMAAGVLNISSRVTITRSTISGNTATIAGGIGSAADSATFTEIVNSTISGNVAASGGGGIMNFNGLLRISLSTITANTSQQDSAGGGLRTAGSLGTFNILKGNIIAGNTGGDVAGEYGAMPDSSLGYNIVGTAGANVDLAVSFPRATDQRGVTNPMLGALADNGGPTWTHALLTNSPAINAGTCTDHNGATVSTDQRGTARPQPADGACDAGAFELALYFESGCSIMVNPKNGQRTAAIDWVNAAPGVVQVLVTSDGRTTQKSLSPLASGSLSVRIRGLTATYTLLSGTSRRAVTDTLVGPDAPCAN